MFDCRKYSDLDGRGIYRQEAHIRAAATEHTGRRRRTMQGLGFFDLDDLAHVLRDPDPIAPRIENGGVPKGPKSMKLPARSVSTLLSRQPSDF